MSQDQSTPLATPVPSRSQPEKKSARQRILERATVICEFTDQDALDCSALYAVAGPHKQVDIDRPSEWVWIHVDGIIDRITHAIHSDFVEGSSGDDRLQRLMEAVATRSTEVGGVVMLRDFQLDECPQKATTLWLMPNERGNWTLMYPQDYCS